MVVIQLDSEQLSSLIQNSVCKTISGTKEKSGYNLNQKRSAFKNHRKKSNYKKRTRFPKPGKLLRWLIQLFFVFVLHSTVNHASVYKGCAHSEWQ